jgi:hypothetical protein
MVKVTAGITRLTPRSDGPVSPLSSPGRGIQAAQSATDTAAQAIARNRPQSIQGQTGISRPLTRSAPHDGQIDDPRSIKPRKLPMNRPMVTPSKG